MPSWTDAVKVQGAREGNGGGGMARGSGEGWPWVGVDDGIFTGKKSEVHGFSLSCFK